MTFPVPDCNNPACPLHHGGNAPYCHNAERQWVSFELSGCRALFASMPADPLAKPLMASRIKWLEERLAALDKALPT